MDVYIKISLFTTYLKKYYLLQYVVLSLKINIQTNYTNNHGIWHIAIYIFIVAF